MSEPKDNLFKSFVPAPNLLDLDWVDKMGEAPLNNLTSLKKLVRSLIEENHVWRLDYLVKQSEDKINLGETSLWEVFIHVETKVV